MCNKVKTKLFILCTDDGTDYPDNQNHWAFVGPQYATDGIARALAASRIESGWLHGPLKLLPAWLADAVITASSGRGHRLAHAPVAAWSRELVGFVCFL